MREPDLVAYVMTNLGKKTSSHIKNEKKKDASLAEPHGNSTYFIGLEHGSQSQWIINILTLGKGDGSKLIIGNYFNHYSL